MRWLAPVIACGLGVTPACSDPGTLCERSFKARDWPRAVELCAKAFEATGDPGTAGRLSWAEYQQGNGQKAVDRLQKLGGWN